MTITSQTSSIIAKFNQFLWFRRMLIIDLKESLLWILVDTLFLFFFHRHTVTTQFIKTMNITKTNQTNPRMLGTPFSDNSVILFWNIKNMETMIVRLNSKSQSWTFKIVLSNGLTITFHTQTQIQVNRKVTVWMRPCFHPKINTQARASLLQRKMKWSSM